MKFDEKELAAKAWADLEMAASATGALEVARVTLPIEKVRALVNERAALSSAAVAEREPVAWPTERVNIPEPGNHGCRIVGFRIREGDEAWGAHGLSEPLFWLERMCRRASPPTSELEAENARLRDRVAELEKAIEPFAAVAEHDIGEDEADDDIFWPISNARYSMSGRLRVSHLRAARRVREGEKADG